MFRSVWDQIHYGMDTIYLHRTGSDLNSIVPYGIASGPIWYQRADLIHTGSIWSHVNIRLTNTNFILVPKGSSPCKCCLNLWPLGILATLNSRFFSQPFWVFLLASWHFIWLISLFHYMWAFKASFTVLLQPKCSWCEFSPPLVVLTLFGHFWQKESSLNLPIPLTPSSLWGLRCPNNQTRICNSETSYSDAQTLWLSVLIFKTCSDQILAKLISLGDCSCSFLVP